MRIKLARFAGYKCLLCRETHDTDSVHRSTLLLTNGYPNGLCPMTGRWAGETHSGEKLWCEMLYHYSYADVRDDFWTLDTDARDRIANDLATRNP